jgi:hypothetical protein
MCTIRRVVSERGFRVIETPQLWGASIDNDPSLREAMDNVRAAGMLVCAVEIEGVNAAEVLVVDHHNQRSAYPSSLLQVLTLIGQRPTRYDLLVAANDTGWIPAMEELRATPEEVRAIRDLEYRSQGITQQEIEEAQVAVAVACKLGNTTVVRCGHTRTAPITDTLFMRDRVTDVAVIGPEREGRQEIVYFGPRPLELLAAVGIAVEQTAHGFKSSQGWCGGGLPAQGFVGFMADSAGDSLRKALDFFAQRGELSPAGTMRHRDHIQPQLPSLVLRAGVKCVLSDPLAQVGRVGGATFVDGRWYSFTRDARTAEAFGNIIEESGDAVFIPTLQKDGAPVPPAIIEDLKMEAKTRLGLTEIRSGLGIWILSETGEPQLEYVWIASSETSQRSDPTALRAFAQRVQVLTNQDSVAIEVGGQLEFFPSVGAGAPPAHALVVDNDDMDLHKRRELRITADTARVWVVPQNDAEAAAAIDLLRRNHEIVLVSKQPWGASWEGLEPEIREAVQIYRAINPRGEVIGVQLAGMNEWNAVTIEPNRVVGGAVRTIQVPSALHFISQVLGVELNRFEELVDDNNRGYRAAMTEGGASIQEQIVIRAMDRAAQGVTADDEAQARRDLLGAEWSIGAHGKRVLVDVSSSHHTPHSDALYYSSEPPSESLFRCSDKIIYYGPRVDEFKSLALSTEGSSIARTWSGGGKTAGYFGIKNPTSAAREAISARFREC